MGRWLCFLLVCLAGSAPAIAQEALVRDVTIIDPEAGSRRPHTDVYIRNGRIVRVADTGTIRPSHPVRVIDGASRFLMPGLWDAHVHLFNLGEPAFGLLIANGITSVRDMGGDAEQLAAWRRRIDGGQLTGPRLRFCGPMLEGPSPALPANHWIVAGPAEARATVARLRAAGVDCIKVRTFANRETYLALAEAARASGLPMMGHPPFAFDPVEVAPAGQRTFEHAFYPYPFHSLPDDRRQAILDAFRSSGVVLVPTMVAWAPSARNQQDLRRFMNTLTPDTAARAFISPSLRYNWLDGLGHMAGRGTRGWANTINQAARDVHTMYDAGIPVLAGTDLGAPFVRPDTGLYEELELLVHQVGLSPAATIAAATSRPARLFHQEHELGLVAEGYLADLVLLDRDPLLDIANIRSVRTVIARGVIYGPRDRARLRAAAVRGIRAMHPDAFSRLSPTTPGPTAIAD